MPIRTDSNDVDTQLDVLVVGAGGCGLVAAIAAARRGISVGIVEKLGRPGGNSALSTGSVPAANSRFQREAGIEDSPERMYDDLIRQSGPHDAMPLVRQLAEGSASLVEWLVDEAHVKLGLITDYRHVGHSVPRLHAPASRRGIDLVKDLTVTVQELEIPLALSNPVSDLLIDEAGAVCGVQVSGDRLAATRIGAEKTILAANGFAANREMVREYVPEIAAASYFGAFGSTGEAIRWGADLQAALGNMGAYQGYATVAYPHGSIMSWTVVEKGGALVDATGQRFGDESGGYSGFAAEVLARGEYAYAIFDATIRDYVSSHELEFRELRELGGVKTADDLGTLAAAFELPPSALTATVATYNDCAAGMGRDRFGRSEFGLAPLRPPYCICKVTPGLFHTQGGLMVDESARPVRSSGAPIANLYAGGGVVAGLSGRTGATGYSSGNGLLSALGLGRIAGFAAAEEVHSRRDAARLR
jgi:fumarate reductase flavoprotein subunit